MIKQARPGQILLGDFHLMTADASKNKNVKLNAGDFIHEARHRLSSLRNLVLGGDPIKSINCYLTGSRRPDGGYNIHKYRLLDKHGYSRLVFNAKVNIHRQSDDPIFLGIQDAELSDFGMADTGKTATV